MPPFIAHLIHLYEVEIWRSDHLHDRSLRGRSYALLRVISITITGLLETKAASRAAALSFSSLLGLGPLVALAVFVAGFTLDRNDPHLAVDSLNRVLKFIAPQIAQFEASTQATKSETSRPTPETGQASGEAASAPTPPDADAEPPVIVESATPAAGQIAVNSDLVALINGFISGSRSGAAGFIGAFTLILIVLQLFTSVENVFNEIWGVRRGRSWLMRVVFYWTVLTLGSVLFFGGLTTLSAGTFLNFFAEKVPFGANLVLVLQWALPSLSVCLLIAVLTLFYRFIPNTHVWWRAALIGAVVVAVLILGNNFLAFLYFKRVVMQQSLFGSLALPVVIMLGLYIFWFFVLLGGQVSYAVQNVHFRNSQAVWNNLAESMRERLSLIVLLTICRRFHSCLPACTAEQLSDMLKVPTNILNECLNRLVRMDLVTPIPPLDASSGTADFRFQPARPLSRITLAEFKRRDDDFGDDPSGPLLADLDPVVTRYNTAVSTLFAGEFFNRSLEELFEHHSLDTSRPPFAFGAAVPRATPSADVPPAA